MINEVTVLSGKGGTGKTSITAALAAYANDTVYCDCDVDASDLHLLLNPKVRESHAFTSGLKAVIDPDKCISCGLCETECRFLAISQPKADLYKVDPYKCEGCRLCERICPAQAIYTFENKNNAWYVSDTRFGPMVHARMGPGEENSGKLVTTVRKRAKDLAGQKKLKNILNDGPPGIGCPVIASITGATKVLLVVEPSKSGIHDIKRLADLVRKFNIPAFAIINKYDLNIKMSLTAEQALSKLNIPVLGKIDFDESFVKAMIEGQSIVEYAPRSETSQFLKDISKKLFA